MTTSGIEGVLLDIDGVLTISWEAIPGAPEAVARLQSAGLPFLLATNTTTVGRAGLAAKLNRAGFDVDASRLVTAPAITSAYLHSHHPGARCYLLAKGDAADDLDGIELVDEGADVVVVAGAEEAFSYDNMNRAFRMLTDGAALVAMHRNRSWMTSEGLKLDAGPYVSALEEAAGVTAAVTGKPSPDFFHAAVGLLGVAPERVAMVGDDIRNDILAAQEVGLTGVLVRTGKFTDESLDGAPGRPDHVIDSVADLRSLLRAAE